MSEFNCAPSHVDGHSVGHSGGAYLKYEGFPNETFYDYVSIVPNPELDETDAKRYMFSPPLNYTSLNGTYRVGIRLKGTSDTCKVAPKTLPN